MDLVNMTDTIRIDRSTGTGSVIDVINMLCPGNTRQAATDAIKAVRESCPELSEKILRLKIDGKGCLTPCADAKTLVEIVWALPGKAARDFRRSSAKTVCRIMGGDLSLVQEIEGRYHALQGTEGGRAAQDFLMSDASSSDEKQGVKRFKGELPVELQLADPAQRSAYFDAWMQERQVQVQERAVRQQLGIVKEGVELLTMLGVADDRDKIACGDLVRRIMQPTSADGYANALVLRAPVPPDDPKVPTPDCLPMHRGEEISMHSVASSLGIRVTTGKEGIVGKAMKRLYAARYGNVAANNIPKRNIPYRGQVFAENTYWSRDKAMMADAILQVCHP
jgi:hypothetical protein